MKIYYMLACRECGDPDRPLAMPFGSAAERGKWASAHTAATGHGTWWAYCYRTDDYGNA